MSLIPYACPLRARVRASIEGPLEPSREREEAGVRRRVTARPSGIRRLGWVAVARPAKRATVRPMRLALRHVVTSSAIAVVAASIAACSGSTASIGSAGSAEGTSDASVDGLTGSSGGPSTDGGGGKTDSGGKADSGGGDDAGVFVVNEKPSPQCNDLAQTAPTITPVGMPGPPPDATPLTTITPGLYIATSIIDYGGSTAIDPTPTQTTVFFTATKQYYVHDVENGAHQQITLSWQVTESKLVRQILCSKDGTGNTVSYRIDETPKGFTVFVDPNQEGRVEAVRYERVQ